MSYTTSWRNGVPSSKKRRISSWLVLARWGWVRHQTPSPPPYSPSLRIVWRAERRIPGEAPSSRYHRLDSLISFTLQNKNITIVHSQTLVLNQTYPVKFREMVGSQFKARNIDFILNDVAESFPDSDSGEVGLKSGHKVQADLIVSCISRVDAARLLSTVVSDQVRTSGPRPNTEFLASSFGKDILSEEKRVLVSPQLQVVDHPSVFAAGDIVDWAEQKQFGKTVGQAAVVAANIISHLAGKPLKKKYTGSPEIIILANGKV